MRALTLQPHWAHAVAHLGKRVENRSRPIPRALVGERIAIHAGATLPPGWIHELRAHAAVWGPLATRAIVAVATVRPHDPPNMAALRARFAPLVYHASPPPWADPDAAHWWELTNVVALANPVPVPRGQLGLWTLDPETEAAVRREEERCRESST